MRTSEVVKLVAGAIAVYVVVAACAASEGAYAVMADAGGGASSGSSASGTSASGGLIDAITHPVPDAKAAPEIAEEPCDKRYVNPTGTSLSYAEHQYPGVSTLDLSGVSAIVPGVGAPPGFDRQTSSIIWVREGAVAALCTIGSTVSFVRR